LLDTMGRSQEAADAFAAALGTHSKLEPYSRFRLALAYERVGHPEVAAGLVATVVASDVPRNLLTDAVQLLARTLEKGGDCRLLHGLDPGRLPRAEGRRLRVLLGNCALRMNDPERARELFLGLLREDLHDEPERLAAERLAALERPEGSPGLDPSLERGRLEQAVPTLLGMALHQHRDFARSIVYLGRVVPLFSDPLGSREFDIGYARARGFFWQERFPQAAQELGWLAQHSTDDGRRAQAFFQQARAYELAGRRRQAYETFRAAYRAQPDGRWADAALFSMLRLQWIAHQEDEGEKIYALLVSQRAWRGMAARAALFLAASDLVRGRSDRAPVWLNQASRVRGAQIEVSYWRGRLAELLGQTDPAVDAYLAVLRQDVFHPLAHAARNRLSQPHLAKAARIRGAKAAQLDQPRALYDAWLLLGDANPVGERARERLLKSLAADRFAAPFLDLEPVPTQEWPLWEATLRRPEEMLLALGVWGQGAAAITEHFPLSNPDLGFTASRLLASAGETQRSIRLAEILFERVPDRLPEPLLPPAFRQLLHPLAQQRPLLAAAARFDVDPLLLAAIIREESRFDAEALSAASARGLTQFVQPTAERIARQIGLGRLSPQDVYRPTVALLLGAAYLADLERDFRGAPEMAVAAYNAGEPQAALWREYCFSSEPEEYFTKVGFRETRNYLAKVLGSWARYRDLYPPVVDPPRAEPQRTSLPN
jgi:soluble lytic murein transglycosylase